MEASSPLAAMHGGGLHPWQRNFFGGGHPNPLSQPSPDVFGGRLAVKARTDYFSLQPFRGSSPTVNLAADLSQNFRIDNQKSPELPTPRRALFTTKNIFGAWERREHITTPPIPLSSSPGLGDAMDITPVPRHGITVAQIEIQTPTPITTPDIDDMCMDSSPAPVIRRASHDSLLRPNGPERRKLGSRRPSLSRAKGLSFGGMSNRLYPDSQLPHFRFGGELRGPISAAPSPFVEGLQDSPIIDSRPQSSSNSSVSSLASQGRSRTHISSLSSTTISRSGVPSLAHTRRPSNSFIRPRRQFRRSLSMFENSGEMVRSTKEEEVVAPRCPLQPVVDANEPATPSLPHFYPEGQNDSIPRINTTTFTQALDGCFDENYNTVLVIDCRFEYEYQGGHINGAINYTDKQQLSEYLLQQSQPGRTLIIFHCEYSAHRAPLMARYIRSQDRALNAEFYPRLTYPEMYILDGGYSNFFIRHRERCFPQAYVEMGAVEHANTCEKEMGRLKQTRKGLSRAQTFAFGQHSPEVDDSPTLAGQINRFDCSFESPTVMLERGPARRMVSY